jgi:hypothetical protein
MNFRFALLVTPGEDILPRVGGGQDSSSYCGLVDSDYPDRRAMGYPFNRPFGTPVKDWLTGGARPQQLISTIVTIRHLDRRSSAR